jgi:hypothetical protein
VGGLVLTDVPDGEKWRGPAGVVDSHLTRTLSRMLSDQADDAYHGGAKHDIKFRPFTPFGRFVQGFVGAREEEARKGRQKADSRAQRAYSQAVKKWLAFAFSIDPSNFNAFFIYYNYLAEDYADVEISDGGEPEGGEVEDESQATARYAQRVGRQAGNDGLKEAKVATKAYLRNAKLNNSLECYNAAVGVWMLFDAKTALGEITDRRDGLVETRRKMQSLFSLGESRGAGRAHPKDVDGARQYARAILVRLAEAVEVQGASKKTPFPNIHKLGRMPE